MRFAALNILAIVYVTVIATIVALRLRQNATFPHPSDDLSKGDQSTHGEDL